MRHVECPGADYLRLFKCRFCHLVKNDNLDSFFPSSGILVLASAPCPGAVPVPPRPPLGLGCRGLARAGIDPSPPTGSVAAVPERSLRSSSPSFLLVHVTDCHAGAAHLTGASRGLSLLEGELAGGPWPAAGSGFRCCWRRRWLAWPRRCGPGPSTSKPTTGATPCTPTTSSSGTMRVRPRRWAASSSTRPFDATVTCSSVPALGPDPASQVSHCPVLPSEGAAIRVWISPGGCLTPSASAQPNHLPCLSHLALSPSS